MRVCHLAWWLGHPLVNAGQTTNASHPKPSPNTRSGTAVTASLTGLLGAKLYIAGSKGRSPWDDKKKIITSAFENVASCFKKPANVFSECRPSWCSGVFLQCRSSSSSTASFFSCTSPLINSSPSHPPPLPHPQAPSTPSKQSRPSRSSSGSSPPPSRRCSPRGSAPRGSGSRGGARWGWCS
jgi:hypothetical protein